MGQVDMQPTVVNSNNGTKRYIEVGYDFQQKITFSQNLFICFHCSPNHWYYLVIQAIVSQSWYVKDSPSKRTLTACLLHVEKGRPNSPSFIHSSFSYFYLLVIKTSIWHILRWQTFNSFLIIQGFNAYHVLCYRHLSLSPFLSL